MSIAALRRIQIGREATRGTAVAATKRLLGGTLRFTPTLGLYMPDDEERNSLGLLHRRTTIGQHAALRYEGSATFEQLINVLAMGLKGGVEPASTTPTGAKYGDNGVVSNMANAIDDNAATEQSFAGFVAAQDYIYVRAAAEFRGVKFTVGTTPNASASSISAVECSDGAGGWLAGTLVVDGTKSPGGSASLARTGIVQFTPHASWASDTFDGDAGFWLRITWDGNWTASTDIQEIDTVPLACVWTYTPSLTAANTPDAFTVEYGDDQQEYESAFCMAEQIELTLALDAPWRMAAQMFGRYPTKSTFTGALAAPTVEDVVGAMAKVYIDTTWGGLGGTQKSNTLLAAVLRFPTGIAMTRYADGSLDFSSYSEGKRAADVELLFRHDATGEAEYDAYAADGGTLRFIRLETEGSTITGSTPKILRTDLAVRYTEPPEFFEEVNGETAVRLKGRTFVDPTSGNDLSVMVRNAVACIDGAT